MAWRASRRVKIDCACAVVLDHRLLGLLVVFALDAVGVVTGDAASRRSSSRRRAHAGDRAGNRLRRPSRAFAPASSVAMAPAIERLDVAHRDRQERRRAARQHAFEDAEVAGNLASGGISSVRTFSGNDAALVSGRPASSLRPAGTSSRNAVFSGKPGAEGHGVDGRVARAATLAGYVLPAASTRRMRAASRARDRRGERQRQRQDREALRVLVDALARERRAERRPHLERQRLVGARRRPRDVDSMPAPQTSFTSTSAAACARRRA